MNVSLENPNPTIALRAKLEPAGTLTLSKALDASHRSPDGTAVEGLINHFPFRALIDGNGKAGKVSGALCQAARPKKDGSVTLELTRIGDEPEIRVPLDLREALFQHAGALEQWLDITPNARRDWVLWLLTAKQSKTREDRIAKACDMLGSGKRRVCCFGGLNWLIKDYALPDEEIWQPLPQV